MLVSWIQALHTVHYGTGTTREGGVPRLTLTGIRFLLTSAIGQNPLLGLGPPPRKPSRGCHGSVRFLLPYLTPSRQGLALASGVYHASLTITTRPYARNRVKSPRTTLGLTHPIEG